jgi:hypothetical protein
LILLVRYSHVADVEGVGGLATQWTTDVFEAVNTLGNPPVWFAATLPMTPQLACATSSPYGAGSVLERCEFYAAASATLLTGAGTSDEFQLDGLSMLFQAEVYSAGTGGLPDPRTGSNTPGVLTASASPRYKATRGAATVQASYGWSTGGYVTSVAKRGPAHYGSGVPELRVAVYTPNLFDPSTIGLIDSTDLYVVRALWKA